MARAGKRRRISTALDSDDDVEDQNEPAAPQEEEDDGLGGMKWECVAVSLEDVHNFLAGTDKTKDPNEKVLRDRVQNHLVPVLEGLEEKRKKRDRERMRDLANLEKMANAKRSSRLASKAELQKQEEEAREDERKRLAETAALRKEEQQRRKLEKERDNRLMSREHRLRERETRRLQHEEELAQLSEDSRNVSGAAGRISERRRLLEIEKNKQALKELEEEEGDWAFDCVCGLFGQVDDGGHSVSCERCSVWQHSKCLGISEEAAERDDFHFVCDSCRRRQDELQTPRRPVIKIKVNRPTSSSPSVPSAGPASASAKSGPQPTAGRHGVSHGYRDPSPARQRCKGQRRAQPARGG